MPNVIVLILLLRLQMVQHFTELDLRICSARISSDGGWFVDGEKCGLCGLCSGRAGCCSVRVVNKLLHACTVSDPQGLLPCRHLTAVFHLAEANGEKVRAATATGMQQKPEKPLSSSVFCGLCILPPALVAQHTSEVIAPVPPSSARCATPRSCSPSSRCSTCTCSRRRTCCSTEVRGAHAALHADACQPLPHYRCSMAAMQQLQVAR